MLRLKIWRGLHIQFLWLLDPQRQLPLSQGAFCDLRYLDLTGPRRDSPDFSLCLSGMRFFKYCFVLFAFVCVHECV